ncbi:MAG: mechanosensitive ion channel family protein [Nitrospirota bacterium]|jgi:small conductance mechanosensitive channel
MDLLVKYVEQVQWETVMFTVLRILLIMIIARVALTAAKIALRRLEATLIDRGQEEGEIPSEAEKRAETLARLLRQGIVILIWLVAALVVLREMGVEIGPILASAGVAGLAIGFGAQNLVRDVISGFFMILENQVRVGDVAVVNGTGGLVERVNFRTIVLRDLSGIVHVFPNGTISTMANLTREWSAYVFDIGVAYKEDVDRVMEIMREVGRELRADAVFGPLMVADVEVFGVDAFGDSAVMIKGRLRTKPIKQWDVGREYRRRLKKAFDAQGIEIPFPHRSIYFGEASKPILAQLAEGAADRVT